MSNKLVVLNIICFKKPCSLTILTNDNIVIEKTELNSLNSKICFCTKEQSFKLIARFNYQTIYKTICINNFKRQSIDVLLSFNTKLFQKAYNTILLLDANYGFPIKNAVLNFKQ